MFLPKTFLDGKITFKLNLYANLCNQIHDSTTFNGKKTFDHQQHDILHKALLFGMIFLETPLVVAKKLKLELGATSGLLLIGS
jgi:hypothetical protein